MRGRSSSWLVRGTTVLALFLLGCGGKASVKKVVGADGGLVGDEAGAPGAEADGAAPPADGPTMAGGAEVARSVDGAGGIGGSAGMGGSAGIGSAGMSGSAGSAGVDAAAAGLDASAGGTTDGNAGSGGGSGGAGGAGGFAGSPGADASIDATADGGADAPADAGGAAADASIDAGVDMGAAIDTSPATPDTGGPTGCQDSTNCANGQTCQNGACVCPPYQALCGGRCIPTSTDPANCGGCGISCQAPQVCSAGKCSSGCLTGLTACQQSCVDTTSDNGNCGACGNVCPAGTGCAQGQCKPAATLGPPPAKCSGGGPPIQLLGGAQQTCAGNLAQVTFRWALCSCSNVTTSQEFKTDAFQSVQGPYQPGGLGGGVGLNGTWASSFSTDVSGALWSSAAAGMKTSSSTNVHQQLHVGGPFNGRVTVGADAFVAGNISGGPVSITGALHQPAAATITGTVTYGSLIHEPVTVPPPCDCAASQLIPVAAIVAARQTSNDNAAIGLDPALLAKGKQQPGRVDLPCGNYYFDSISAAGPLTIAAHGRTGIYVGGDVVSSTPLTITLDATAELDLFIAGTLVTSQTLIIGSPNYPALTRVYVGSAAKLQFSNTAAVAGNFYAAYAQVRWSAPTDIYGAVFAGDFNSSQKTHIHYDLSVLQAGKACAPPPSPGCKSCQDCNNQACVNGACGQCRTDDDCCAPLVCFQGKCIPT
jgi:hypothetical protein